MVMPYLILSNIDLKRPKERERERERCLNDTYINIRNAYISVHFFFSFFSFQINYIRFVADLTNLMINLKRDVPHIAGLN
jgi:hypothetical protein